MDIIVWSRSICRHIHRIGEKVPEPLRPETWPELLTVMPLYWPTALAAPFADAAGLRQR
jgi:hypothetical protein